MDEDTRDPLSAPFAQWPVTVGYSAFYPLPTSFFDHVYVEDTPRLIKDRDTYAAYLDSFETTREGAHR